jgi:hypothetical protein
MRDLTEEEYNYIINCSGKELFNFCFSFMNKECQMDQMSIPSSKPAVICKQKGCNARFRPRNDEHVRCDVCERMIRLGLEIKEDK